jgi:2-methylcitrate dehydratase PrpD
VELKNGTRFSHTARIAKGDPRNPMTEEEVLEKFQSNVRSLIPVKQSEALLAAMKNFERLDNVRKVVDLLTPDS